MKRLPVLLTGVWGLLALVACSPGNISEPPPAAIVEVAQSEQFGSYLTDAGGGTLYLFVNPTAEGQDPERMTEGVRAAAAPCAGQCLQTWPPFTAEGQVQAGEGVDTELLYTATVDGRSQVIYNGWTLYYYVGDTQPGQINGQGIASFGGEWFILSPAGHKIEMPATEDIALEQIASGLTHPVMLAEAPDSTGRLFIVDQTGQIWILASEGTLLTEPFLDISERMVTLNPSYDERGLLGLAFHPDYGQNGRFFVYYSAPLHAEAPDEFNHTSHLAEFTVSATDPNQAAADSERILLAIDQPQGNHNAGTLAFGPTDGYLYVSLGDGGGANDTGVGHMEDWYDANAGGNGQDIEQNLLGSILRLDVDAGEPYAVPADNPFVGSAGLGEIYAYGFRNPYRFSFDVAGTHELYVGDAGQELYEEVSLVEKAGNYGWNIKEGAHCFDAANPENPPASCPGTVGEGHPRTGDPLIDPVIELRNSGAFDDGHGVVVVGGYVYRGSALPSLDGTYLFGVWSRGDNNGGAIFTAETAQEGMWDFAPLSLEGNPNGELQEFLLSFAQDLNGEVYVLTTQEVGPTGDTGKVYRLGPVNGQ